LWAIIDVYVNVNPHRPVRHPPEEHFMEIQGKVFIVTGGASGLGEGTARMLAEAGGKVVIADMQVEKGEAVAREIGGAFVKCDVSQEADGQAVVARATGMGKLMGLINCAGIAPAEKTVGKNGAHALSVYTKTIMSTWWAAST
jgi:NAD(P)-dependent dehydrogenase (short-subunit alcohol dehydrogenase family)